MAAIVSKLARASFATRAFPLARPAAAIRASPAGGPKSEVAPHAATAPCKPHLTVDENALKSDEAMWDFYEYWCKYHGVSRDRAEMERRFKFFCDTARSVHNFNARSSGFAKAAMASTADMSTEEMSRYYFGKNKF